MTRLEAFLERLKGIAALTRISPLREKDTYFVGIDSGSHATKIACINNKKEIVFCDMTPTGVSVKDSVNKLISNMMSKTGCSDIKKYVITATGYGRNQIGYSNKSVTEITCHAKGAFKRLMSAATIIDIGGQDSKVVKFDTSGDVIRFAMNDKCAAGTGRFLEVIAERLQLPLSEFATLASSSSQSVPISNMCTVFAESEVISLIAAGHSRESIAKGIHRAIAERTASLVKRADGEAPFYMSGGVAKNRSIVRELESFLNEKISVIENPQLNGAIGAAMISLESV
jgi:predicted CoA-substrate-specific enzyme activase